MDTVGILYTLRTSAGLAAFKPHVHVRAPLLEALTSLYGPACPSGESLTLYVVVESPRRCPARAKFAYGLRERGLSDVAGGRCCHSFEQVVPVLNVAALCAGRSVAHVNGGGTQHARLRENGTALCRAAVAEAEACVVAARRARKAENRAARAEDARVALEAARHVADVIVPAFATMAPDLWDLVAAAYVREAALIDRRPGELPEEDADALGTLI